MKKVLGFVAIAAAMSVAACDDSVGVNGRTDTSVSFTRQSQATLFAPQLSMQDSIVIGAHTINVTSVDLGISKFEIEGDSVEVEMKKSATISVPLNGAVVTPFSSLLPAGVYDELKFHLQSVRMQGTFDGQPFDATVRVVTEVEMDIDPPLVVGDSGKANLTVALSPAQWFTNNQGGVIDPRNMDASATAQLMSNIKASLRAFDDDNRNGRHDSGDDDDHDDDHDD